MRTEELRRQTIRGDRYRWALLALAMVLLSTLVLVGRGSAATAYDTEELQFLDLINDYRIENGLQPVILSDTLTIAAEHHSLDMADYGFFAHDTEQSSYYPAGSEPWDRMEAEGYGYNTAKGENLAVGYETAEEAMQAWQRSASHNAAMLDGNYRVMGVARINAPGSVHGWYWTTDFGGYVDPSAHAAGEPPAGPDQEEPASHAPGKPAERTTPPQDTDRDTGALENGGMGRLGAWSQKARDGADLLLEEGYARLGGYHDGRDDLRQKVRVRPDSRLAYDVKVKTGFRDRDDVMIVRLSDGKGKPVAVPRKYTGRDASGWDRERVDLSRFAGRTLYLSFHARTDTGRLTTFYVDRVLLRP